MPVPAWWWPFANYGVIHGDPHLGNYTIFEEGGRPAGINLLDYGCVRTFTPEFVEGVIMLYRGLQHEDRDMIISAYESGALKAVLRGHRDPEHLGALHLWPAAG